jgi:hypothetical protein
MPHYRSANASPPDDQSQKDGGEEGGRDAGRQRGCRGGQEGKRGRQEGGQEGPRAALREIFVLQSTRFPQLDPLLLRPIDDLKLSYRCLKSLKAENIFRTGDLVELTETELLQVPKLGLKALIEIKAALASWGLTLCSREERLANRVHKRS